MVPTSPPELPKPSRTPGKKTKTYVFEPENVQNHSGKKSDYPHIFLFGGTLWVVLRLIMGLSRHFVDVVGLSEVCASLPVAQIIVLFRFVLVHPGR